MKKKILVVCQRFWPEHQKINEICEGLKERDCKVDVLCGRPVRPNGSFYPGYGAFRPREEEHNDLHIYRAAEIRKTGSTGLNIFFSHISFFITSWFRSFSLSRNRYDRIFIYQLSPLTMASGGFRIAKRQGVPVTLYCASLWPFSILRELDVHSAVLKKLITSFSRSYYRRADRIIAPTEKIQEYFIKELEIPAGRVLYVPPFPSETYENKVRDRWVMEKYSGSFNIFCAGGTSDEQDWKTILECGEMLRRAGIRDVRFMITGAGRRLELLRRQAEKRHLGDSFYFEETDDISEISKYLFVADVFLECTKLEFIDEYYIPDLLIDLMSVGRPLITTSGEQTKAMVADAGCGFSAEPGNAKSLFDVIMRLYRLSFEELEKLGENASAYQKEHFDRDKNTDAMLEIMLEKKYAEQDGGKGSSVIAYGREEIEEILPSEEKKEE